MNEADYGTFSACKRLADAGIVLETERVWILNEWPITVDGHVIYKEERKLIDQPMIGYKKQVPAPSMAEVWRELPPELNIYGNLQTIRAEKLCQDTGPVLTSAQYVYEDKNHGELMQHFNANINPTDALIDLLIWVRKSDGNPGNKIA